MPNTPVWGNSDDTRANDQDLISADNSGSVIEVKNINAAKAAVQATNLSNDADARALKAAGMSEVIANSADNPASTGLLVKNLSTDDNSIALQVEGPSEDDRTKLVLKHCTIESDGADDIRIGTGLTNSVRVGHINRSSIAEGIWLTVQTLGVGNGIVDAYVPGQPAETRDLKLGNGNSTENVTVSRSGKVTSVMGRMDVEEHARIGTAGNDGKVDAAADTRDLKVGTDANATNNVQISQSGKETDVKGRLDAEEHIRVGTGAAGKVDASANNLDIKLGTDANATNNVQISRSGKEADVKGRLDAEEHIRVGGTGVGADGKVDAAASNRDLKLGTDSNYTNHVIIGRSGRVVEVTGGTIWLNALHTFGLDLNEAGHNPGHPSIDVYISGAVEAYIDDQGIHNA